MACGLPSVATRVGAIPELIENGENGLLVEPKNPEGLTQAILEVIRSEDKRTQWGKRALETIRTRHGNWEHQAKLLMNLYQKIIHSKKDS